jgi:nicotinate dehydrogenase subunit B
MPSIRFRLNGVETEVDADPDSSLLTVLRMTGPHFSVRRLTIAVDVGEAINPAGVINQIEGGASQATSWVLKERVRFDRQRITSNTWASYPILRFSEVPEVQVEFIPRPELEPLGAGEAAHGPVTAAIANAVFDALEVRVRDLPITRDSLIAAMELSS